MEKAAGLSFFLGVSSLAAAIATLNNKPLTLTFFTFAGFCFLVLFAQMGQYLSSGSENFVQDVYTPLNTSRFPPVDESRFAPIIRLPSVPTAPSFIEDNPTELFGGFLKFLK